ncbi:putative gibberellin regulated protein [Helianthus anomalus]
MPHADWVATCRIMPHGGGIITSYHYTWSKSGSCVLGYCDSKCAVRCSKASLQDRCLKYCGICCEECHCVPSGTYGNKDECPCYRDKKNSKDGSKCP